MIIENNFKEYFIYTSPIEELLTKVAESID